MNYHVFVSAAADEDLLRLARFLAARDPNAAQRAAAKIKASIRTLSSMPNRARIESDRLHSLRVPFGRSGYLIWFEIAGGQVTVSRIFHMREDR